MLEISDNVALKFLRTRFTKMFFPIISISMLNTLNPSWGLGIGLGVMISSLYTEPLMLILAFLVHWFMREKKINDKIYLKRVFFLKKYFISSKYRYTFQFWAFSYHKDFFNLFFTFYSIGGGESLSITSSYFMWIQVIFKFYTQ